MPEDETALAGRHMTARPPHSITPDMLSRVAQIGEAIGRAEAASVARDLRLRRINRIRTIQGSLAIEGNVLSEEQSATILVRPAQETPQVTPKSDACCPCWPGRCPGGTSCRRSGSATASGCGSDTCCRNCSAGTWR